MWSPQARAAALAARHAKAGANSPGSNPVLASRAQRKVASAKRREAAAITKAWAPTPSGRRRSTLTKAAGMHVESRTNRRRQAEGAAIEYGSNRGRIGLAA